ncbi:three-Cys-motif partner protein [Sphingomonas sp. NFR04]|uniref:three-Cys-motif partner protein TcmP n=1 Tax=Sphingomonas sp. NFR04 TaxID=1566283 RepID=UPI0008E07FD7|nr:three-Cys-motif partner protein TcmP [Sphingomonas sp. NFR04]SFK03211.1 three-Cys-motif partner protein [Sphingomonas sp. NFR04]
MSGEHWFGAGWTEVKLNAISAYSTFFTGAIGRKFDIWYVDPFAGTGSRSSEEEVGGIFEGEPFSTIEKRYPGSAARALTVDPPFHHFRFGDTKKQHIQALEELVAFYPEKDAKVIRKDANDFVRGMFGDPFWSDPNGRGKGSRALVFLDPYGLEVKWSTLEALANCQKADVWFLANLKAAVQQLSHDHAKLDDGKRRALCEYFGTDQWEAKFYSEAPSGGGLLSFMDERKKRSASKAEIADFHRNQLEGLFKYVSPPLPLAVGSVDDYFLLYCMSNNPAPAARALIAKGANWVIQKYKQASHHKSALREGVR